LIQLIFDDVAKQIRGVIKVLDDATWRMILEGAFTGVSQGGRYVRRWDEGGVTYYTVNPFEVSIVDNPCLPSARFQVVKGDGAIEERRFKSSLTTRDDYFAHKAEVFAQIDRDERSGFLKKTSAATELLQKADAVGGLEMACRLNPDLVVKLKDEPLPSDGLLPSERLAFMSVRSGLSMSEIIKADAALAEEYRLEMLGAHPLQVARNEAATAASRESYALRKSVTADGPIPALQVQVFHNGALENDKARRLAWIAWAQKDRTVVLQHNLKFMVHGAVIQAGDIEAVK
jgi:hypothetical protein